MVVDDFDTVRFTLCPAEADTKLVVDPDAVLTFTQADELFEAVAWRSTEVIKPDRGVKLPEFSERDSLYIAPKPPHGKTLKKALSVLIGEAPDHRPIITQRVISINRNWPRIKIRPTISNNS